MYITLNTVRKQSKNQLKLLKIVTFLNIVFLIMMMLSFDAKASKLSDVLMESSRQQQEQQRHNEQLENDRRMIRALNKIAGCTNDYCY